jgi:predicted nucleic acid-binding protein
MGHLHVIFSIRFSTCEIQVKALDALHVACAEVANAHYFVTCDDRLVRRYRRRGGTLQICDPIDFVRAVAGE